jgi:phasin family protein
MSVKSKKTAVAETVAQEGQVALASVKQAGDEAMSTVFVGYEQFADLSRDNMAALIKANTVLSQGLEAIGKEFMGYAKHSFETAAETAKALLAAKTIEDVVQLNTEYAKSSVERMIERSAKLSEMGVKVANETLAPLGGRVEATIQKLSKPLAA